MRCFGVHILQINYIKVHGGIEYLKLLWGLVVKREPAERYEDQVEDDKEYIEGNIYFIPPNEVTPILEDAEVEPADIDKDQSKQKSQC